MKNTIRHESRLLAAIDHGLKRLSKTQVTAFSFALVMLFGIGDHLSGYDVSFLLFYLVPVIIAAWYAGKETGISVALIASIATLWADLGSHPFDKHYLAVVWTVTSRFGTFVVIATLLDMLRARFEYEQQLARVDSLTGSLNRHAFMEQFQYNLDLAAREKLPFVLAYIDVDDFKQTNDKHGHDAGDKVLTAVACTLRQFSRRTDLVSRLGGDEFAMLLPNTSESGAQNIIAKVKNAFETAFNGDGPGISCSIGVVTFLNAPPDAAAAIKAADLLMYEVKNSGKNSVAFRTLGSPSARGRQAGMDA